MITFIIGVLVGIPLTLIISWIFAILYDKYKQKHGRYLRKFLH